MQSLPRELTYDPVLQQLCFQPVAEQADLRLLPPLANFTGIQMPAHSNHSLGNWPGSVGNTSEVRVVFRKPSSPTTFGVGIMLDDDDNPQQVAFVDYIPPDYIPPTNMTAPTSDHSGAGHRHANGNFSVKVGLRPPPPAHSPGTVDELQMLPDDTEVDVRIFYDNGLAEVFFMQGRVVMTLKISATARAGFAIYSGGAAVEVVSASAWQVGSIWVPRKEIGALGADLL
jgi:sucrose-6-phosphate hydrolase SacC (GH32 family)